MAVRTGEIERRRRLSESPWTIIDVIGVYTLVFFGMFILYGLSISITKNELTTNYLVRYFGAIIGILVPLFWIKKRYGMQRRILGLTKNSLDTSKIILLGTITALASFLLIGVISFFQKSVPIKVGGSTHFIQLLLLPLSISGFATVILSPICEEISERGFLYGYLRGHLGVILGLFLQALLFSLMHFNSLIEKDILLIINRVLMGLILGILYERTGSLYPSMICHGLCNYLSIIFISMRGL